MARNNTDERVVQLMLDSKEFDQNAKKSIQSLDDLKKALEFEGASKGFENINNAARKVDLSIMDNGIQKVQNHFNALETIATTALERITNKTLDAGTALIKSFTVDPLMSGWQKFSDTTTASATLLAQGYSLETVEDQLERLNWYTDETSYNFVDMVSNISKFTAAGKGLEDSVTAMEGIANWAAVSGQNAATASRAMYQLSQAMSAGVMRKEDWRSIQNANMDTQEFRQHAIDAALAMGTLREVSSGVYQSLVATSNAGKELFTVDQFAESLTQGVWFTSDVMMEVFKDYSSAVDQIYDYATEKNITASEAIEELGDEVDQFGLKTFKAAQQARTWADVVDSVKDAVSTGWSNTYKAIFGNTEEATELFTAMANTLYDVFAEAGNARNELLRGWREGGGRETLLEGFKELWKNVQGVLDSISGAWENIFGKTFEEQVQDLLNFTEGFKRFAEGIVFTEGTFQDLLRILESVFRVLKTITNVIKTVGRALEPIFRLLNRLGSVVLRLVADLAELLSFKFDNLFNEQRLQSAYNMLNTIAKVIAVLAGRGLNGLVQAIDMVIAGLGTLYSIFEEYTGGFDVIFLKLTKAVWDFWNAFEAGETFANKVIDAILVVLGGGVAGIYNLVKTIVSAFNGEEFKPEGTFGTISDWLTKVKENFDKIDLENKLAGFLDAFRLLSSYIGEFFRDLQNADSKLRQTFSAFGGELKVFYEWFKRIITEMSAEDIAKIGMMVAIAKLIFGVSDLTKAFKNLTNASKGVVTTVDVLLKQLKDGNAESLMSRISGIFAKTRILQIGLGVTMLTAAFNQINKMDYATTVRSLVLIVAAMGSLLLIFKKWSEISAAADELRTKNAKESQVGLMLLEIGAAFYLLGQAIKVMHDAIGEDIEGMAALIPSLFGIVALAAGLLLMLKALDKINPKSMVETGAAMLLIAGSITMLTVPLAILSKIDFLTMAGGLIGVAGLLVSVGTAAYLIQRVDWKTMLTSAVAFTAMATAITMLAVPVLALGKMGEGYGAGLGATVALIMSLGAAIGLLGVFCSQTPPAVFLSMAAAFVSFAASIDLLAFAALMLQNADLGNLAIVAGGFAVVLGVLTAALMVGGPLATAALDSLGNACLKAGVAFLAVGAGATLLALAFEILQGGIIALGLASVAFGDEFAVVLNKGLEATRIILDGLIDIILELAPKIALAAGTIWAAIQAAKWYNQLDSELAKKVIRIGAAVISAIGTLGGPIMDALIKIVDSLNSRLPDLIEVIGEFLFNLLQGIGLLIRDFVGGVFYLIRAAVTGEMVDYDTFLQKGFENSMGYAADGIMAGGGQLTKSFEEVAQEAGEAGVLATMNAIGASSPAKEFTKTVEYAAMGVEEGGEKYLTPESEKQGANAGDALAGSFRERAIDGVAGAVPEIRQYMGAAFGDIETEYANMFGDMEGLVTGWSRKKVNTVGGDYSRYDKKLDESKRVLDVYTPSEETKEDVKDDFFDFGSDAGESFTKGVGSGASAPKTVEKTAEEIVDEHLKAINDAYSRGVKQLDLASSRLDLKDKLWNLMNKEPGEEDTAAQAAYEAAKKEHELEMLDAQMEIQLGKINEAQAKYTDKLKLLGSSAAETQEEYNNLLEQQYKILELYSEKQELMTEQSDSSADAFIAASKEVSSYHELLEQGLITEEMYLSAAQSKLAAFRKEESDLQKEHATQLDNSLAAVLERLEQNGGDLKDAFGAIMSDTLVDAIHNLPDNSEELSWSMTKVVSDGLEQVYLDPNFKESTEGLGVNIMDGAVNGLDDAKGTFVKVSGSVAKEGLNEMADELGVASPSKKTYKFGQWIDDGLVNGILNRKAKVLEAAIAVAKGAIKAAKEALGIASPSKEFTAIGVLSDLGLARGLENGSDQVLKTGKKVVTNLLSTTKDELDQNGKYVSDYLKNTFGVSDETLRLQVIVDADTSLADASINELQRAYALKTGSLGAVDTAATFNAGSTDYLLQKLNEQEAFRATKLQSMYDLMSSYVEMERLKSFEKSQGTEDSSTTIVNYNQTNVSPKPISALDTYRNTKKQLDTFETKIKGSKSGKKTYRI